MNTILYINPLWREISFFIFQNKNTIIEKLDKNLDTAITFPKKLVDLVDLYNIKEIWCIVGPGPFTLMRIITLGINSLKYTNNITLKSCNFFDLISKNNTGIIESNSKEFIIKNDDIITIIDKNILPKWTYEGITFEKFSTEEIKYIQYNDERKNIENIFSLKLSEIQISPVYFKPPHITCPKP